MHLKPFYLNRSQLTISVIYSDENTVTQWTSNKPIPGEFCPWMQQRKAFLVQVALKTRLSVQVQKINRKAVPLQ